MCMAATPRCTSLRPRFVARSPSCWSGTAPMSARAIDEEHSRCTTRQMAITPNPAAQAATIELLRVDRCRSARGRPLGSRPSAPSRPNPLPCGGTGAAGRRRRSSAAECSRLDAAASCGSTHGTRRLWFRGGTSAASSDRAAAARAGREAYRSRRQRQRRVQSGGGRLGPPCAQRRSRLASPPPRRAPVLGDCVRRPRDHDLRRLDDGDGIITTPQPE